MINSTSHYPNKSRVSSFVGLASSKFHNCNQLKRRNWLLLAGVVAFVGISALLAFGELAEQLTTINSGNHLMKSSANFHQSIGFSPVYPTRFSCLDRFQSDVEEQIYLNNMRQLDLNNNVNSTKCFGGNRLSIYKNMNEPRKKAKSLSLSHLDCSSKDKKYLIINPRGGLGNRLGSIASAYAIARGYRWW